MSIQLAILGLAAALLVGAFLLKYVLVFAAATLLSTVVFTVHAALNKVAPALQRYRWL